MNVCGAVEVRLHIFLISTLDGCQWSALRFVTVNSRSLSGDNFVGFELVLEHWKKENCFYLCWELNTDPLVVQSAAVSESAVPASVS